MRAASALLPTPACAPLLGWRPPRAGCILFWSHRFTKEAPVKYSRRDLSLLLPALAAATASAQSTAKNTAKTGKQAEPVASADGVEKLPVMKTQAFLYKDIPVTVNGQNKSRRM